MANFRYPIVTSTLPNGLKLVINEDPLAPGVALNLWYQVGSADELDGSFGFAHLFEHLMFQGSKQVKPGEHLTLVQSLGGDCNATTSFDRTNYFETLPVESFELGLWLESERMASLNISQENLDTQREVVKEEKRQRYDNQPYGQLLFHLLELQYPGGHPYRHPTIGNMPDLDGANLAQVQDFFNTWYRPNNAVLSVVSPLTTSQVEQTVAKYFSHIRPADLPKRTVLEPLDHHTCDTVAKVSAPVPSSVVSLCWRVPNLLDPTHRRLAQGLTILGSGTTSRFYRKLVKEKQLAQGVAAYDLGLARSSSSCIISAICADSADPKRVRDELLDQVQQLIDDGPTAAEKDRVYASFEREWLSELAAMDARADNLSSYTTLFDDPNRINTELDEVKSIDCAEIQQSLATWLRPENAATLYLLKG